MTTQRTLQHLGDEWLFKMSGYGVGVGSGHIPQASAFGLDIVSTQAKKFPPMHTTIWTSDINSLSTDQLVRVLEEELVVAAIDHSKWVWRTTEGIGKELGLPAEKVHTLLINQPDRVIESIRPNRHGKLLYTTRSKYKKNRSFFGRYIDVLNSSASGSSE